MFLHRFVGSWLVFALLFSAAGAEQYEMSPADEEAVSAPTPDRAPEATARAPAPEQRASLPYTPYPAGLSWVLTPQSFRVPITDRFYYPPHTYVKRCPYYPRGYYWGANWRFHVVGRGNLLFMGPFRFNPYLTAVKAAHHPELRGKQRYAPPPGPIGQSKLLGSQGPAPFVALPPTQAVGSPRAKSKSTATERRAATVRRVPDRHEAQPVSSRRSKRAKPASKSSK